ncbi:MAG TPA: site-2 protease family protein [Oligoflexia bacterium]|nr:site-2 protease family protein [Oligoflexia bacterium]HMP47064.1 site-2 protease family protein [Oligoflexia bacterium]
MNSVLINVLVSVPPLLVAIVLHEVAHGYSAWKLGDPTAKVLGRITLNPIKHIDPVLSILLPGILILSGSPIIFGGAKPVPVNPTYFKNPRQGMAIVALAGPVTNFILCGICYFSFLAIINQNIEDSPMLALLTIWLLGGIIINLALGLFNLIPLPPLDGGRIAVGFLPLAIARVWARLEPYGLILIFGLLYLGLPQQILEPAIEFVTTQLEKNIGPLIP